MIGRENDVIANKWTWFDTQVCATFLWSWMIRLILMVLVDYIDMLRIIGRILDNLYALSVSMNDSIGTITSYFHTSMVVHPGSNNHLRIRNLIHGNMLSSSLKKQQNRKVLLNNGILGVDYKIMINMLMKQLYIAVRYFYITNRPISGDISRVIYKPTKTMKNDYFTQAIQGKLFNCGCTCSKNKLVNESINQFTPLLK